MKYKLIESFTAAKIRRSKITPALLYEESCWPGYRYHQSGHTTSHRHRSPPDQRWIGFEDAAGECSCEIHEGLWLMKVERDTNTEYQGGINQVARLRRVDRRQIGVQLFMRHQQTAVEAS